MDRHAKQGPGVSGAFPCILAELRPSRAQAQESTLQSAIPALNTAHTAPGRQLPVMVHLPGLHHPMAYLHARHEPTLCTAMNAGLFIKSLSNSPCRNHSLQKCGDKRRKQASLTLNHFARVFLVQGQSLHQYRNHHMCLPDIHPTNDSLFSYKLPAGKTKKSSLLGGVLGKQHSRRIIVRNALPILYVMTHEHLQHPGCNQ